LLYGIHTLRLVQQFNDLAQPARPGEGSGQAFLWTPSGKAIFYEGQFRGAQNIWRLTVDPRTSTAVTLERMTTGEIDSDPAISLDGKRLAFTSSSLRMRSWLFPFDASRGRIKGSGRPITSAGLRAWRNDMSRTGDVLAFVGMLGGKSQLWEKSLPDGKESPLLAADSYLRRFPRLSWDGTKLAYNRRNINGESQLMLLSRHSHTEEPLTSVSKTMLVPFDWSPDGNSILCSRVTTERDHADVWQIPVSAKPHAEAAARVIISDPRYDLWQPHFSWDGKWIVFIAVNNSPNEFESGIHVIPASGGDWIRITDGHPWDDKPRWSPDGKTVYFVSSKSGIFNVFGMRFDAIKRTPVGQPFAVTSFENVGTQIAENIQNVDMSLTEDKLVLTMEDRTGNVWILDNVDR
jgi:Tol biopolymer transport system component